jgi:hypothetical protein
MKNTKELRTEMSSVISALRDKSLPHGTAREMINATGKIIASVKLELEYANMRKEKPSVDFLR